MNKKTSCSLLGIVSLFIMATLLSSLLFPTEIDRTGDTDVAFVEVEPYLKTTQLQSTINLLDPITRGKKVILIKPGEKIN